MVELNDLKGLLPLKHFCDSIYQNDVASKPNTKAKPRNTQFAA